MVGEVEEPLRAAKARMGLGAKLALSAVSFALAGSVAFFLWKRLRPQAAPEPGTIRLLAPTDENEIYARLRARDLRSPPVPLSLLPTTTLKRQRLDPVAARLIFPMLTLKETEYDPDCYFRHASSMHETIPFKEIEGEGFDIVTNSLGLREDAEPASPPPDVLLIATGDSHVDGVCDNRDTFPNLLEAALLQRFPGRSVEVWNAGMAGYSLYNYLGVLERFRARAPLGFVMVCFGGNDFYDLPKIARFFRRDSPPPHDNQFEESMYALGQSPSRVVHHAIQGVQQAAWFARHPEQSAEAAQVALEVTGEVADLCAADGIHFLCVYLPSALDVQAQLYEPELAAAMQALDLTWERAHVADEIADRWLAGLRDRGVDCLDLRESFRACPEPLYWHADLHLNTHGQALLAGGARERVEAWLREPRQGER